MAPPQKGKSLRSKRDPKKEEETAVERTLRKEIERRQETLKNIFAYFWDCIKEAWESLMYGNIQQHFGWNAFLYGIVGIVMIVSYMYQIPVTNSTDPSYVCPITPNFMIMNGAFIAQSVCYGITSMAWSTISKKPKEAFSSSSVGLHGLGVMARGGPLILRAIMVCNYVQLGIMYVQLWTLPECNFRSLRIMTFILGIFWMAMIGLGRAAKKRITVPAYLHVPPSGERGFIHEMKVLIRSMGP